MTHTGPQNMLDTVYCGVRMYLLPVLLRGALSDLVPIRHNDYTIFTTIRCGLLDLELIGLCDVNVFCIALYDLLC